MRKWVRCLAVRGQSRLEQEHSSSAQIVLGCQNFGLGLGILTFSTYNLSWALTTWSRSIIETASIWIKTSHHLISRSSRSSMLSVWYKFLIITFITAHKLLIQSVILALVRQENPVNHNKAKFWESLWVWNIPKFTLNMIFVIFKLRSILAILITKIKIISKVNFWIFSQKLKYPRIHPRYDFHIFC